MVSDCSFFTSVVFFIQSGIVLVASGAGDNGSVRVSVIASGILSSESSAGGVERFSILVPTIGVSGIVATGLFFGTSILGVTVLGAIGTLSQSGIFSGAGRFSFIGSGRVGFSTTGFVGVYTGALFTTGA